MLKANILKYPGDKYVKNNWACHKQEVARENENRIMKVKQITIAGPDRPILKTGTAQSNGDNCERKERNRF